MIIIVAVFFTNTTAVLCPEFCSLSTAIHVVQILQNNFIVEIGAKNITKLLSFETVAVVVCLLNYVILMKRLYPAIGAPYQLV